MVDQITFRTDDNLRWGLGRGSDLSASDIDINFWVLLTAVQALQAETNSRAGIDHFVIVGNNLFVHLTNHFVLGPYLLPVAQWNFTNAWSARKVYQPFDVFTQSGAVYLVLVQHVSNSIFSPGSANTLGQPYYGLLLAAPAPELPQTGSKGAVLQWQNSPGDVRWNLPTRNIAFYLETTPDPVEFVMDYVFTEATNFPASLTGSQFTVGTRPTGDQEFEILKNGVNIGHVIVHHTGAPTVVFSAVQFATSEVLSVVGPTVPDAHMTRIRFNLVGTLD